MRPADDLWLQLVELDRDLEDRIWSGDALPSELPDWGGELAALISVAAGPATAEELGDEAAIVQAMREATLAGDRCRAAAPATPSSPDRAKEPLLAPALKIGAAVAAAVLGLATAAAATDVAPSPFPSWGPRAQPEVETPGSIVDADEDVPGDDGPATGGDDRERCAGRHAECAADGDETDGTDGTDGERDSTGGGAPAGAGEKPMSSETPPGDPSPTPQGPPDGAGAAGDPPGHGPDPGPPGTGGGGPGRSGSAPGQGQQGGGNGGGGPPDGGPPGAGGGQAGNSGGAPGNKPPGAGGGAG